MDLELRQTVREVREILRQQNEVVTSGKLASCVGTRNQGYFHKELLNAIDAIVIRQD